MTSQVTYITGTFPTLAQRSQTTEGAISIKVTVLNMLTLGI
jgi:hypothetical protein